MTAESRCGRPVLDNGSLTHVSLGAYPTQRFGYYGINTRSPDEDTEVHC
jgi:hypothetical protein